MCGPPNPRVFGTRHVTRQGTSAAPATLVTAPVTLVTAPVTLVSAPVTLVTAPVTLVAAPVTLVAAPVTALVTLVLGTRPPPLPGDTLLAVSIWADFLGAAAI